MPYNYFTNGTEVELLAMKESLQRRLTRGEIYMTTYAGDQQMRSFQGGPKSIKSVIRDIDLALYEIDPDRYPLQQRVRRTISDFSQ